MMVVNDCRLDLEDHAFLATLPEVPAVFRGFGRPEEVSAKAWHHAENQGQMGSCQGNDLSSCLEKCCYVATGKVVQLSRIFAYLATQKIDGLLGRDAGSTISGGVKLAIDYGVPPETLTGYPRGYPNLSDRSRILSEENYGAAAEYKALSAWNCPADVELALDWLGGGGAISLGISWYNGIIPGDRIVRRFAPPSRSGGHAIAILGYTRDGNFEVWNSHGDGVFYITPDAFLQMRRHTYTAAIGLSGFSNPKPVSWDQTDLAKRMAELRKKRGET